MTMTTTAAIQPQRAPILLENIPLCLRQRPQWVVWRYVLRDGKPTKCPFDARTAGEASSTDPATWCSFELAVQTWQDDERWSGIGFVFTAEDPYCGVDLDDSIDPDLGTLKPWAQQIVQELDSYCEISPSGTGVKLFLLADKPGERCRRRYQDGEVEIYDQGRFFTVTGQRLEEFPPEVQPRQEELAQLYQQVFGLQPVPSQPQPSVLSSTPSLPQHLALSDEQILQKAQASSRRGSKFSDLWAGHWNGYFGSQSEADSSVVFTLAFYTKDAGQIDRLFRRSGLMRPKWDQKHGVQTYGQMTIAKALSQVTAQWQPRRSVASSSGGAAAAEGPASADADGLIPLGQRDPQTQRIVLSPKRTLPTAQAFLQQFYHHPEGRMLHSYAGTLLVWRGNRFAEIEEEGLRQQLQPWLHGALRYLPNKRSGLMELVDFESNPNTIKAAVESIRAYAHLPASLTPPAWLWAADAWPDPRELLPCLHGNLHIPSGQMLAATPALFTVNALDYDYDPNAKPPVRWLQFLQQLWGEDRESIQLLQEWMGYCLVTDTSQQKMLLLVGPKRSGKGTIGRILTHLVGAGNVVGPTTSSLGGPFGLQPLIGKSLAIVSDARFGGESVGVVVERLLCISGEDTLTVDRKFLGSVTMKLPTRFVFLTNELPRMSDASGALAGRFTILRLTHSFYGQEDVTLTGKLMEELPGILLWAIEGLKRLRARGHFVQPSAVAEAVREMEDLASPVLAFVRDRCVVSPGQRVWVDALYNAWKSWCEQEGRTAITNKQMFGRDLAAAVPGVVRRRGAGDVAFYEGIDLKESQP